jgi:hypothetical protein
MSKKKMFAKELQILQASNRIMDRDVKPNFNDEPTKAYEEARENMEEIGAALTPLLVELLEAGLLNIGTDKDATERLPKELRVLNVVWDGNVDVLCDMGGVARTQDEVDGAAS